MKENFIKYEIIVDLNISSYEINKVIRIVELISSQRILNFSDIFKDKIYDLEKYFDEKDKSFYSSSLGQSILWYFNDLYIDVKDYIYELGNTLSKLPDLLSKKYVILASYIFIKEYKKSCDKLLNFSIEDSTFKVLKTYFQNISFYDYLPGDIYRIYEDIKKDMKDLKLQELTKKMECQILSIINNKEKKLKNLYELAKDECEYNSLEDIYEYIQSIVTVIKEKNKQKKR